MGWLSRKGSEADYREARDAFREMHDSADWPIRDDDEYEASRALDERAWLAEGRLTKWQRARLDDEAKRW